MSASSSPAVERRPWGLVLAAAFLALEGLAAGVLGVLGLTEMQASGPLVGVGAGVLLIAFAVGLVLLARGVWRARRWSRGPAVACELILLPVAWDFQGGSTTGVSVALALAAVLTLVGLLSPAATRVLAGPDPAEDRTGGRDAG